MKSLQERPVMTFSRLLGVNKLVPGAAGCSRHGQSNHCSSGGEDHLGIALFWTCCQMITPCWFHYNQVKEGMDLKEAEVGFGIGSSQSAGIAEGLLIVASLIVASLWIERYAARYARYARWVQEHSTVQKICQPCQVRQKICQPCQVSTRTRCCTEDIPAMPSEYKNTVMYRRYAIHATWV